MGTPDDFNQLATSASPSPAQRSLSWDNDRMIYNTSKLIATFAGNPAIAATDIAVI